jgi:hypothetical protein
MEIVHRGSPRTGAALARALEAEGLQVHWEQPGETRSLGTDVHEIVIQVIATGATAAIGLSAKAAISKFKQQFPGADAEVRGRPDDGPRHRR